MTVLIVSTLLKFALFVLGFVMPLASLLTWLERRQSAYMQDRMGPNRADLRFGGKRLTVAGLLHIVADGLKMFFKEPFKPELANGGLFRVAPGIGFVTTLTIAALIPFGPDLQTPWGVIPMQIARVETGLLLVFAIGSLGVYGAALAGWASNNRFALLGGLRAASQGISYEIALGLTAVGVLIAFGATELSAIVAAQDGVFAGGMVPTWGLFYQPAAAVLFLAAAIAETKRGPFDAPEGESEIIGYFVEYSSMGFGLFMLGEFAEIVVLSSLFTTLFLGGWHLPWVLGESTINLGLWTIEATPIARGLTAMLIFGAKVFLVCSFQLAIRWTLPRFRYDQIMWLGWKNLLPLALVNIFLTAVLVWVDPSLNLLGYVGLGMIGLFLLVVIAGPRQAPQRVAAPSH